MRHSVEILTVLTLAALTALISLAPASAQQTQTPLFIELDPQLDDIVDEFGGLDALVGRTVCASVAYPTDDRSLVVGGPGTPAECNQEWRVVTLTGHGDYAPLGNNIVLHPGETVFVSTIMPFPSIDGPDVPPFWIDLRATGAVSIEDVRALGSLTAYVEGAWCGSVELTDGEEAFALPIGRPGTPELCRELGAEVVLADGRGRQLAVRPSIISNVGLFYALEDLTLDPQGRGVPIPGASGDAGLAAPEDATPPVTLWLLVLAVLLAGGRYLTRAAPTQSRFR
jgi:hypothetical protein